MSQDTYTDEAPSAAMTALSRLNGTWKVSGGATGTVTYEPLDGGHFLMQHVELESSGQLNKGIEVIGHLNPFGEGRSELVHSRFYDNGGNTFDYVYELDDDTLWIWAGEKGSPAYFKGMLSDNDSKLAGAWVYPGGGGYESTSTRVNGS